ncbi:uncharacterized protein LOC129224178 [Uloborus diversus]|uniref:uncharacterized protein LOC129224178 n=1 Tax=Uloborus diversus TaxID=327109 RepID=UPI0024098102|nr:uncharacterized protein LOC129224178 [Uloborus diversus]
MIYIIVVASTLMTTAWSEPQCHTTEMWQCSNIAIDWFHTLPPKSIPESEAEIETMCQEGRNTINCFNGYGKRCMSPLQKELAALIFEGAIELYNELCTKGSPSQDKLLKHAPCLNEVFKTEEIKTLLDHILVTFKKSHIVPLQDVLPFTCCGINKSCHKFLGLIRKTCDDEAADLVKDLKLLAVGQLPEALCKEGDGSEEICQQLLPPDDAKLSATEDSPFLKTLKDVLKNWMD